MKNKLTELVVNHIDDKNIIEKEVIGALLQMKIEELDIALPKINSAWFSPQNELIIKSIERLYNKNEWGDFTTVAVDLGSNLKVIGGRAYIAECIASAYTTRINKQITTLQDQYSIKLLSETSNIDKSDSSSILQGLQNIQENIESNIITNIELKYNVEDILHESYKEMCEREDGKIVGYNTGIKSLNEKIEGQLKGKFILIEGYNSHGKSTLLGQLMVSALQDGAKCLYISLESSPVEIINKALANISGYNIYDFKYKTKKDVSAIYDKLMKKPLTIINHLYEIDGIISVIKKYARKGLIDCVYIDYIQNIQSRKIHDERLRLDYISKKFQELVLQENILLACASQTSNEAVKNKIGFTSGSRGSGQISASSDVTLRIIRDVNELGVKTNEFGIFIQKCRYNATGYVQCVINEAKGIIKEVEEKQFNNSNYK